MDIKKPDILEEAARDFEMGLVEKVKRSRDRRAFHDLVKLHDGMVFSIAYRILGNREDALEAAQDTFVKAFMKMRQYRGEVPLKYWMRKIAVNTCLNRLRTRKSDCLNGAGEINDDYSRDIRKEVSGPDDDYETAERDRAVRNALLKVNEPFRAALVLRDIEGYRYEEIATMLKVSVGTVKSRLSRGRLELRAILDGEKREAVEDEMR